MKHRATKKHRTTGFAESRSDADARIETAYILSSGCLIDIPCHCCTNAITVTLKTLTSTSLLNRVVLCDHCGEPQCLSKTLCQWLIRRLKQEGYYYQKAKRVDQPFGLECQSELPVIETKNENLLSQVLHLVSKFQGDTLHQPTCQDKPCEG